MSAADGPGAEGGHPPAWKATRFAKEGLDFSTLFAAKFLKDEINGHKPLMRDPPAVSTGGGKQAVQHIVLNPKVEGDAVITIGHANVVTKTARLRTYDCLEQMHALRFRGRPFIIAQARYQEFFDKLITFLRKQGMQVDVETRPPSDDAVALSRRAPVGRPSSSSKLGWVVLGLLIIVLVLLAVFRRELNLPF